MTAFRITPAGVVSVASGNGGDTPSGTQTAATVNIRCTGGNNACSNGTAYGKIAKVNTTSGRANTVSNFTVASGTATVGTVTTNGDGSIQFRVTNLANNTNRTIFVGMDLPIKGDDQSTLTTATAQWTVNVDESSWPSVPGTNATATATVRKSISATTTTLSYGPIRRPGSSSGTVTINATSGARTAGGTNAPGLVTGGSASRGTVVVSGQASQTFTITTPASFTLTNGTTTLTSTVTRTATGSLTLSAAGVYTLGIGGVLTVPSSVTTGNYTGSLTATIAYN